MSENITGYGTLLYIGTATGDTLPAYASDTYNLIIDVEDLVPPSSTRAVEEWYVLDQVASKKRGGSLTYSPATANVTRAYSDTYHDMLEDNSMAAAQVRRNWKIVKPNTGGEIQYFAGFVSKFQFDSITNQTRQKFALEITVDGSPTIVR